MSFRGLLNNVCILKEKTFSEDTYGDQRPSYKVLKDNVPCRFQNKGQTVMRSGVIQTADYSFSLFLEKDSVPELSRSEHLFEVFGQDYNIDSVIDLGGCGKYLEVGLSVSETRGKNNGG